MKTLIVILTLAVCAMAQSAHQLGATASKHSIVLTWQLAAPYSGPPIPFQIWRNDCAPKAKFNLVGSTLGVLTWTETTNVGLGKTYCFQVTNSKGTSNIAKVTVPTT